MDIKKYNEKNNPIAFFCMEYAIDENPGTYAGGLGILAGDYLLEAAEQNLPVMAFGIHYKSGFDGLVPVNTIPVSIAGEVINVKVWQRNMGESVKMFLFDTDIPENSDQNRLISSKLYDSDFYNRIKQQMILGICGVRVLKDLGIKPHIYHLNEGHTAFAVLALLAEGGEVKSRIAGTKHTIFSDAGIFISKVDFDKYVSPYCIENGLSSEDIFEKGKYENDPDKFSTTKFLIANSDIKNGVSVLHTVYEKKVHTNSELIPITNGVYKKRWQDSEWGNYKEKTDDEIISIKNSLRKNLLSFVKEKTGEDLNLDICTIVWARRFAAYKRPFLLFSDIERLKNILSDSERPLQVVISGKSHPADALGQETINKIVTLSQTPEFKGKIVYVPDYSVQISKYLVRGADIWLNTPEMGKEACGTSGIKASLNGALQCSVSDGWVDEEDWTNVGFVLSENETAENLYKYLEKDIKDAFYDKETRVKMMRATIDKAESRYTATRMLNDYVEKVYNF